ncbi:MAG: RidA family protein [Candidatus Sumerlaeia bacterium]
MPEKVDVVCPTAPAAIGPYSQAIRQGDMVFISGQLPLDPKTGELSDPDITGQTRRVLDNINAILESLGTGTAAVVKTTVFLTSLVDFEMMNEVYAEFFPFCPPARSTVEVSSLPKGALVEIEAMAIMQPAQPSGPNML